MGMLMASKLTRWTISGMNPDTNEPWVPSGAIEGDLIPLNTEGTTGLFAELLEGEMSSDCPTVCSHPNQSTAVLKCIGTDCVSVLSVKIEQVRLSVDLPPFSKIYRDLTVSPQAYSLDDSVGPFVGYSLNSETVAANCDVVIGQ